MLRGSAALMDEAMKNAGLIDRTKGLIFVFAMIAVSAAACNKVKNEFPDAAKNSCLDTCEAGKTKSREVCMCVLEKMQYKYTFKEYSEIQETLKAGKAPSQEFLFFLGDAKGMCMRDYPSDDSSLPAASS
jgi:hypothetical protein